MASCKGHGGQTAEIARNGLSGRPTQRQADRRTSGVTSSAPNFCCQSVLVNVEFDKAVAMVNAVSHAVTNDWKLLAPELDECVFT